MFEYNCVAAFIFEQRICLLFFLWKGIWHSSFFTHGQLLSLNRRLSLFSVNKLCSAHKFVIGFTIGLSITQYSWVHQIRSQYVSVGNIQSWAPATWKEAALPLFGKTSSGAAVYRYSNKKVAPLLLPLRACKTAAAAATLNKQINK